MVAQTRTMVCIPILKVKQDQMELFITGKYQLTHLMYKMD